MIRRRIAMMTLMFIVPLGGWYAKNYIVFGFFGPSSWIGANLLQVASPLLSYDERAALMAQGALSPEFPGGLYKEDAIISRAPPDQAKTHWGSVQPLTEPHKHHLDAIYPNRNYIGYLVSARRDLEDSLAIITRYPGRYAAAVAERYLATAVLPSYSHEQARHSTPMANHAPIVFLELPMPVRATMQIASFALYIGIPVLMAKWLCRSRMRRLRSQVVPSIWRPYVLMSLALIAMMSFIACAFNGWEQERMRWGYAPAYFCLAALWLDLRFRAR